MKRPLLAFLLAVLLAAAVRPANPLAANLCQRLGDEARRPELARTHTDMLLTAALANLGEQDPELKLFLAEILPDDVPPPRRKETFTAGVSAALGEPWDCPDFDALWDGQLRR